MKPRLLTPARLGRPWGRGRFGRVGGKGGEPVGELWVSGDDATLPDGRTLAAAGIAASVPLVKVLDVGGQLSVQVHPDDRLARELHGPDAVGKHEAWLVLEADPGATFALGLVDSSRLDDLFSGDERRVVGSLVFRAATAGSVVEVAPGTVHAPGPGLLLYEVQQRSDLTYRIWDWDRERPINRAEAIRAIRPDAVAWPVPIPGGPGRFDLIGPGAPFRVELCRVAGRRIRLDLARPAVVSHAAGTPAVDDVELAAGSHWLVEPGRVSMTGRGEVLVASWR